MNSTQNQILELWHKLSDDEKKELLQRFGTHKAIVESVRKFKDSTTMGFGSVTTCPTCGR
ncbi:hypothetical protein [Proteus mirabilis]|uniref:hypothetical protein n=1 Tax=Proteus mirabilis TaxID=584 RepID=UPI00217EEAC4|nr:hypothetical protein [Proteus mirabilis]MCS6724288.1 hypothetical protein [Proteus mirabilis]MDF7232181.1 hypothetical protein [Proteus mirabilis]